MFKAKPLKSGAANLGLKLGRGVPKELLSTIEVYAPFAVNDEAQAAAAAEAFQLLESCSLSGSNSLCERVARSQRVRKAVPSAPPVTQCRVVRRWTPLDPAV